MAKYTDNLNETIVRVLQYVGNNAPRGLNETNRAAMKAISLEEISGRGREFWSISFRRGGGSVDFYLHVEPVSSLKGGILTDDEGNDFRVFEVSSSVNWGAYGSQSVANALVYADLLRETALFAAELNAEFEGETIYGLASTKAEKEGRKARVEKEENERIAREIVEANAKGLAKGSSKTISTAKEPLGFGPDGTPITYSVRTKYAGREFRYELRVRIGSDSWEITRTE